MCERTANQLNGYYEGTSRRDRASSKIQKKLIKVKQDGIQGGNVSYPLKSPTVMTGIVARKS